MKWRVAKEESKQFVHIEEDNPGERHVAAVIINNYVAKPAEQHKAEAVKTAKLIAAAPELLEACKAIMQAESTSNADVMEISTKGFERCCAAIAKATT